MAFVVMADPGEAETFRSKLRSPHRFVCDPGAVVFKAFSLGRASAYQLMGPATILAGIRAIAGGHKGGRPVGDPLQMPGVFVIGTDGRVSWRHIARHAGDNPPVAEIASALERASR